MLYIFVFFTLFFFANTTYKNSRILFHFAVLILLVMTCLRAPTIGIDTAGGYYLYYKDLLAGKGLNWLETGWVILNTLSIKMHLGYQGVIFIAGLLTILPVAYVISKVSDDRMLSLSIYYGLYYVLYSFNLVRQSISISFILLFFYFASEKKRFFSLLSFFIAINFHVSSVIALVYLVFVRLYLSFKGTVFLVVCSFVLGLLISDSLFIMIAGPYAHYLMSGDTYAGFRNSILVPALFSMLVSIFFVFLFYVNHDNKNNVWYKMTILGLILMNLTLRFGQGTRLVLFFSQAQVLFMPTYFKGINNIKTKHYIRILFFLYLLVNFLRILVDQWDTLNPYLFFWQAPQF